ncbi:hypothetical protein BC938DRAFT_483774, partial [Jimgerdemannia flammicorona]
LITLYQYTVRVGVNQEEYQTSLRTQKQNLPPGTYFCTPSSFNIGTHVRRPFGFVRTLDELIHKAGYQCTADTSKPLTQEELEHPHPRPPYQHGMDLEANVLRPPRIRPSPLYTPPRTKPSPLHWRLNFTPAACITPLSPGRLRDNDRRPVLRLGVLHARQGFGGVAHPVEFRRREGESDPEHVLALGFLGQVARPGDHQAWGRARVGEGSIQFCLVPHCPRIQICRYQHCKHRRLLMINIYILPIDILTALSVTDPQGAHWNVRAFNTSLPILEAYQIMIDRILKYFTVKHPRVRVFIRGNVYGHFNCSQYTEPLLSPQLPMPVAGQHNWYDMLTMNELWKTSIHDFGNPQITYFDVSFSELRADSHADPKKPDCLHFLLPGPIDSWNRLLYHEIFRKLL